MTYRVVSRISRFCAWAVAAAAVVSGLPATHGATGPRGPVTVLARQRIGGYVEETTFVPRGPFANHIAMTNGTEVRGIPTNANSDAAVKTLFKSLAVGYAVPPKGMAYVESERAFAFVEGASPETLFLADERGRPLPPRAITYLPGVPLDFLHNEGLVYLPPTSPFFPDHLLMIANRFPDVPPFIDATIEVLRRDGVVVAQIRPASPLRENYLTALALKGNDRLLVGLNDQIWTVDFDGNVVADPVAAPGPFVEGLEQLPDGRIVMSAAATLYFFDENLDRLPEDDRDAGVGAGYFVTDGIAWNTDTNEFMLPASLESTGDYFAPTVMASFSATLRESRQLYELDPADRFRMGASAEYLPDEHLTAILLRRVGALPGAIALYDATGHEVERISLAALGSPAAMTYVPATRQFALTFRGAAVDQRIVFVSRTGSFVRAIDLAPIGVDSVRAMTPFDPRHPSGGQLLVVCGATVDASRVVRIDFDGNLLGEFNTRPDLGLVWAYDAATITTGPYAGAFCVADIFNHEVVVFRLN